MNEPTTRAEQTRKMSAVEACTSVAIGFVVALLAQLVILPAWGVDIPLRDHIGISACFTVVSVIRSYVVRRMFEAHAHQG